MLLPAAMHPKGDSNILVWWILKEIVGLALSMNVHRTCFAPFAVFGGVFWNLGKDLGTLVC